MIKKLVCTTVVGVAGLTFIGAAAAAVIGTANTSGRRATIVATAIAPAGRKLSVRITATPAQPVKVSWAVTCSHGLAPKTAEDQPVVRAPVTLKIQSPLPRAKGCIINAAATLSSNGALVIDILAS